VEGKTGNQFQPVYIEGAATSRSGRLEKGAGRKIAAFRESRGKRAEGKQTTETDRGHNSAPRATRRSKTGRVISSEENCGGDLKKWKSSFNEGGAWVLQTEEREEKTVLKKKEKNGQLQGTR